MLRFLDEQGRQTRVRYYGPPALSIYSAFGNAFQVMPGDGFVMPGLCSSQFVQGQAIIWHFYAQGDTLWARRYSILQQSIGV